MEVDKQRKKELAQAYKQTFRTMGVYQIRNVKNGKILLNSTMDMDGARNLLEFSKKMNSTTMFELKRDWDTYGGDSFVFEELDQVKPREEFAGDASDMKKYRTEVATLLELWLEKLQPYGDKGYNRPKRKS